MDPCSHSLPVVLYNSAENKRKQEINQGRRFAMSYILKIISFTGLALTIVPSILVFAGVIVIKIKNNQPQNGIQGQSTWYRNPYSSFKLGNESLRQGNDAVCPLD